MRLPLIALLSLTALPALAEVQMSTAFNTCMNKANGVNVAMQDCIKAEHAQWDKKLNSNYQALLKSLEPAAQTKLKAAQRLWIQYRDANCDTYYAQYEGGTMASLNAGSCLLDMTAARATELETMMQP